MILNFFINTLLLSIVFVTSVKKFVRFHDLFDHVFIISLKYPQSRWDAVQNMIRRMVKIISQWANLSVLQFI